MKIGRLIFLVSVLFASSFCLQAQQVEHYKPSVSRILFLLDGSGSMKEAFEGKSKFQTAKEILYKFTDSVGRKNPNVEFGVRVFGHQYPRSQNNCTDSKLMVPFAKDNSVNIRSILEKITPQGHTPIAYSIEKAAADFPKDEKALNSIILITDGLESCYGDPCKMSRALVDKRVTLKPFIVGLNVKPEDVSKFNCVGTFYEARTEKAFSQTVGLIINQTLNTTTAQINLIDGNGNPTVSNIAFTLFDHASGKVMYNFVHALDQKGNPDTLFLDPVGIYDVEVHTFPSVRKESIELVPGKHNIIGIDVPAGDLSFSCFNSLRENNAQVLVRSKGKNEILNVQDFNESEKYLRGDYDFEILTTPETYTDTAVLAFVNSNMKVEEYGLLSVISDNNYTASIHKRHYTLELVQRYDFKIKAESLKLQPGDYVLIYKPKSDYRTESSKSQHFRIDANRTTVITL